MVISDVNKTASFHFKEESKDILSNHLKKMPHKAALEKVRGDDRHPLSI